LHNDEDILVHVNDKRVRLYVGMKVKHALIACDYSLYKAAKEGRVLVVDDNGFFVGLDGSLHDGARIFTNEKS
jgi:hypothetical protein